MEKTSQALREGAPKLREKLNLAPISTQGTPAPVAGSADEQKTSEPQSQNQSENSYLQYSMDNPALINNPPPVINPPYPNSNGQITDADREIISSSLLPNPYSNPFYQIPYHYDFNMMAQPSDFGQMSQPVGFNTAFPSTVDRRLSIQPAVESYQHPGAPLSSGETKWNELGENDVSQNLAVRRSSSIYAPLPSNVSEQQTKFRTRQSMFRGSNLSALTDYSDMLGSIKTFDFGDFDDFDDFDQFDPVNMTLAGDQQPLGSLSEMQWTAMRSYSRGSRNTSQRDSLHSILSGMTDISVALSSIQMEDDIAEGEGVRRQSVRYEAGDQPVFRRSGFALSEFFKPITTPSFVQSHLPLEDNNNDTEGAVRFSVPPSNQHESDHFISTEPNNDQIPRRRGGSGSSLLRRRSTLSTRFSMLTDAAGFLESTEENDDDGENPIMIWNAADTNLAHNANFLYPSSP